MKKRITPAIIVATTQPLESKSLSDENAANNKKPMTITIVNIKTIILINI